MGCINRLVFFFFFPFGLSLKFFFLVEAAPRPEEKNEIGAAGAGAGTDRTKIAPSMVVVPQKHLVAASRHLTLACTQSRTATPKKKIN